MTKYFINTPILYSSIPYTEGFTSDDHIITWTFDDGEILYGINVYKTWTTQGIHNVQAIARNIKTNTSGNAINITNFIEYAILPQTSNAKYGHAASLLSDGRVLITSSYY